MIGNPSFTNLTKKRLKITEFLRIYKKLLPDWELSVVFAPHFLMKQLNKTYRKKNKVANVLSFKFKEGEGEIFLNSEEKKLLYLFTHACLHLLGYSHKTKKEAEKMEKRENKILFK